MPYRAPFSECRDAAQGLQPVSPTSLTHSLALSRPTYHRISSSLSHQFPTFSYCSSALGIVLSCADAVVDAPLVLQGKCPSLLCGQKEGPCGAADFTLHINSPIVPGASSSSSQLTAFCRLLSSNIFPILIHSTTNHRCSSQSPPTTPILSIQRLLSQFPGKLLSPATMSAAVGMDFPPSRPIPSLSGSPPHLSLHTLYPRLPPTTVLYSVYEEIRTQ